jgi:hypothetical protein
MNYKKIIFWTILIISIPIIIGIAILLSLISIPIIIGIFIGYLFIYETFVHKKKD